MRSRDKIYVMRPALLEPEHDIRELALTYLPAKLRAATYISVLAKNATERAAAKEYRPRTASSAYDRLLKKMQISARHAHIISHPANALVNASVFSARPWAHITPRHFNLLAIIFINYTAFFQK